MLQRNRSLYTANGSVWIDATTLESNLSFAGEVHQEHSQGHTHLRACLVWVILFCLTQPTAGRCLLQVFFRWSFLPALPASFFLRRTSLPLLPSHSARGWRPLVSGPHQRSLFSRLHFHHLISSPAFLSVFLTINNLSLFLSPSSLCLCPQNTCSTS